MRGERLKTILALGLPLVARCRRRRCSTSSTRRWSGGSARKRWRPWHRRIREFHVRRRVARDVGRRSGDGGAAKGRGARRRDRGAAERRAGPGARAGAAAVGRSMAFAPELLALLNDDPAVLEHGGPYLRGAACGVAAAGMNFAFRGYWNGVGRPMVYLRVLVAMQLLNVALNYVLIFGALGFPALGALGSGIGTAATNWAGTAMYFVAAWRGARGAGFLSRLPRRATLATMARVSLPASVQQIFFAAGFTAMMWIVGRVGTDELAAANVLVNVPSGGAPAGDGDGPRGGGAGGAFSGPGRKRRRAAVGVGHGESRGRCHGRARRRNGVGARRHPRRLSRRGTGRRAGSRAAALTGATIVVDAAGMVLMQALNGAGATRTSMTVSVGLQWLLFLPAAFVAGPTLGMGSSASGCATWRGGRCRPSSSPRCGGAGAGPMCAYDGPSRRAGGLTPRRRGAIDRGVYGGKRFGVRSRWRTTNRRRSGFGATSDGGRSTARAGGAFAPRSNRSSGDRLQRQDGGGSRVSRRSAAVDARRLQGRRGAQHDAAHSLPPVGAYQGAVGGGCGGQVTNPAAPSRKMAGLCDGHVASPRGRR